MATELAVGPVADSQHREPKPVQVRGIRCLQPVPEVGTIVGRITVAERAGDHQYVACREIAQRAVVHADQPGREPGRPKLIDDSGCELLGVSGLRCPQHPRAGYRAEPGSDWSVSGARVGSGQNAVDPRPYRLTDRRGFG